MGDKAGTAAAFASAEVKIKELISYHRTHPSPLETCQCVASFDKIKGELTVYGTFQAPHVIRTVASLISKIPEHKIHVISPDIGGGFGNKVGAYPGYICAIVASIVTGKPVKWVEDRIENLTTTSFARDYHMTTEIAATKDGKVTGLRVHTIADHGGFDACANPSKFPAGLFAIVTGSYDFPVAHAVVDAVYTNKAPGGVAYRCSLRVTEAAYAIERGMDILAQKLGMDPAELRLKNFIRPEQFPYQSALGWEYDSGDYHTAMKQGDGRRRLPAAARRAGRQARSLQARRDARDHGDRRVLLHRDRGRGPIEELRHPRPRHVRQLRDPRAPDRLGDGAHELQVARPGPRDHLRPDHRQRDRHPRRRHHGGGGQHRHGALRDRHLRLALHARRRRGHRHGVAQDPQQGADDRRLHAGGARGRPRVGHRRLPRQGPAREVQEHEGDRLGRLQFAAAGHGAGAGGGELLRSPEHDLPVRRLHLRDGHRRRYRRLQGAPLLCARRLRHPHQPHDHRGAGARRADRGVRHRHGPGDPLRRDRQRRGRLVHGLLHADSGGDAASGRPTTRSRPRRTIRSAPRASARAPTSAACRRSPMP